MLFGVFPGRNALTDAMLLAWYVISVLSVRRCIFASTRFVAPIAFRLFYVPKTYSYVLVWSDGPYPSLVLVSRYMFRVYRSLAPITVVSYSRFVLDSFYSLLSVFSHTSHVNHISFALSVSFARFACFVWSV
jgi:hypothetical protein